MKVKKVNKRLNLKKVSIADLGENNTYEIRDAQRVIIKGGAESPSVGPYGGTCYTKVEPPCTDQTTSAVLNC